MKIAVIHLGSLSQLLPASSVLKGMKQHLSTSFDITWVLKDDSLKYVFKYTKDVHRVFSLEEFIQTPEIYDMIVNLDPFFPVNVVGNFEYRMAIGIGFSPDLEIWRKVLTGEEQMPENMNCLQLYFKLCQMVWRGEGYGIQYYPKTKSHKNKVGVSVANSNLRNYVLDHLDLKGMKVWYIPYRKNLFKKMDEVNRCSKIITDDLTTLHASLCLDKYVYFLETSPPVFRPQFWNSGETFKVPVSVFQ